MKIAIISKLWEKTEPTSTGGTGMSVGTLVDGLVDNGHHVTLFATADSKTKARLVSCKNRPYRNDYSEIKEYSNIYQAFKKAKKFDLIHTHVEHKACFFAPLVASPTLITIRYGQFFDDELKLLKENKNLNFSFNSIALKKKFSFLKSLGVVHNGLNLSHYPFNSQADDYLIFLGRLSPQKGIDLAIKACLRAGKKLIIAGKTVAADKNYLKKYVFPYIDNKKIIYLGEINFSQKIKLLKKSLALIQPTQLFEACSNVILEAQACGTPVITTDKGSNKELIKNGRTGYLVTKANIVKYINLIGQIDRKNCRLWVAKNFTAQKMVQGYEQIYKKLI